jgi:hypothetical protein
MRCRRGASGPRGGPRNPRGSPCHPQHRARRGERTVGAQPRCGRRIRTRRAGAARHGAADAPSGRVRGGPRPGPARHRRAPRTPLTGTRWRLAPRHPAHRVADHSGAVSAAGAPSRSHVAAFAVAVRRGLGCPARHGGHQRCDGRVGNRGGCAPGRAYPAVSSAPWPTIGAWSRNSPGGGHKLRLSGSEQRFSELARYGRQPAEDPLTCWLATMPRCASEAPAEPVRCSSPR